MIPREEIENVNIQFTEGQTPDNSDQKTLVQVS